ncbi:hypothetical protein BDD12DRAFT_912112 [Trichophaea hybrida]|nr:hypothetical protein BDD12DRAFT_912112 [Trichophaea hybrida]
MIHKFGHQSEKSIASLHHSCQLSFGQLFQLLGDDGIPQSLQNDIGRYRVWAENSGAHRISRVSLDHRLREASDMKQMVIELLGDLDQVINEAIAIVSGETSLDTQSLHSSDFSDSSSESESDPVVFKPTNDLERCVLELNHIITCLYKFSIAIRNPAPSDKLRKCSKIDVSHFEYFDQQHVREKFPEAAEFLIERLGRANTRRRQLLKYHEKHHEKIAARYDPPSLNASVAEREEMILPLEAVIGDEDGQGEVTAPNQCAARRNETFDTSIIVPNTIAASITITDTTVSTAYFQGERDTTDLRSDADYSQTSYGPSEAGDPEVLRVPPPPNQESAYNYEPFQCPYCYSMITVVGETSWVRHVFGDIRPYVCTFKDCPKQNHLFDSRHEWFEHEQELHRKEWYCNSCGKIFTSSTDFGEHLRKSHPGLQTAMDRCERTIQSEQPCPLCPASCLPGRLQKHLARHMQQTALFVPRPCEDEVGDSDSNGAQADDSDSETRELGVEDELDFDSNSSETSRNSPEGSGGQEIDVELLEGINANERVKEGRSRNDAFPATEGESTKSFIRKWLTKRLTIPGQSGNQEDLWEIENLASSFYNKKQWSKAGKLYSQLFEKRRKLLGEEHPDTLESMYNVASTFHEQGRLNEAAELKLQVLEKRKRVLGEDHPDTLQAIHNLVSTFNAQGRTKEAEELLRQVLEKSKRTLGEDHPDTLMNMQNLASKFLAQGRSREAEGLVWQALEKRKRILGDDHPDTLTSMQNLAMTFHEQGRLGEAEELYVKVMEKRKKVLGDDHPDTLKTMQNLAMVFHEQERLGEAEELQVQVLEKRKRILGEEHLDTLYSMNELATTFYVQGRLSEDEELSVQVLEKRKRLLGKEHPHTLLSMHNLAITANSMGQIDESITTMKEVVALRSRILGTDHPHTKDSVAALAAWVGGKSSVQFLPRYEHDKTADKPR